MPEPEKNFGDSTVLDTKRRPDSESFTVVNRYHAGKLDEQNHLVPTFAKIQCMHCQDPACVSACVTGALSKNENGAVTYNVSKCIGCRYCMIACPFQIPAYEFHDPISPRVRKCNFCFDRISREGGKPACAAACPVEAITFGKRKDLIEIAKRRIERNPEKYVNHIYGEREVGGTCWMYISDVAFDQVGFPPMPERPMPQTPETIQSSLFNYLWSPLALFGALGALMAGISRREGKGGGDDS